MNLPGLLLLFAALAPEVPRDTTVRALTLAEAIALAERNAPAVIHAAGQTRATAASVRSAYGAFLPSVGLSAGATRQLPTHAGPSQDGSGQVLTGSPEPWSHGMGVNAELTLFEGGGRIYELQRAHAQADAATLSLVEQNRFAALAAKQRFFAVLASVDLEAVAQAQLSLSQEQLSISMLRLRARTVTRSDSLRSQILVHNALLAITQARTSRLEAEASLTRVVGTPYPVTAALRDSAGEADPTLDDATLRQLAITGPAVQQAEALRRAAHSALSIAWAGYLPSVTASYGYDASGSTERFSISAAGLASSGALRVAVSLPVFDQFQRASQSAQARASLDDAEAACRDAELAALESLAIWLGAYRAASERVELQSATVEAADEDLREHQEQYNAGSTTMVDVLVSRTVLDQARHDLVQARFDRRIARAQLEALIGRSF